MSVIKPYFLSCYLNYPALKNYLRADKNTQIFSVHYIIIFDISFIIEYSRIKWSHYPPDWLQSVGQYNFSGKFSLGKWNYWSSIRLLHSVNSLHQDFDSSLTWLALLTCMIASWFCQPVQCIPSHYQGEFPPGCTANPTYTTGRATFLDWVAQHCWLSSSSITNIK